MSGTSTRVERRYTRGMPPLAATRIATAPLRAPAIWRLTACDACGCVVWADASAGARDRQPQSARLARRKQARRGRQKAPPARKGNRGGREKVFLVWGLKSGPRTHPPEGGSGGPWGGVWLA